MGGSRISVDELKEFAARQQQEIITKERELKTKQIQLMEMKRKSQKRPQNPYLQQLTAKADEQGEKLTALRKVQDQVDSYKLSNSALGMSEMIPYALVFSDLLYQQGRKKPESQLVFWTNSSHIFACPWSLLSCLS